MRRVQFSDSEIVLQDIDWSPIYPMNDPDNAAKFLTKHVSTLESV